MFIFSTLCLVYLWVDLDNQLDVVFCVALWVDRGAHARSKITGQTLYFMEISLFQNLQLMVSPNRSNNIMISQDFAVLHHETGRVLTEYFEQSPPFRILHTIGWKGNPSPSQMITRLELVEPQSVHRCGIVKVKYSKYWTLGRLGFGK